MIRSVISCGRVLATRQSSSTLSHHRSHCIRQFSVKELSWCSPSHSPNKRSKNSSDDNILKDGNDQGDDDLSSLDPIDKFGIVGAMAAGNRVIGVNGKLPWNNIEHDRKIFTELTENKVLIMGRRTYEEEPSKSHVCHAANCIVVSRTMEAESASADPNVDIARSFPEALHLAKLRANEEERDGLGCWIVGGERIYNEALNHPSAQEVHLTIVNVDIDVAKLKSNDPNTTIALFPPKYRWDRHFDEAERTHHETIDGHGDPLTFTNVLYKRKKWRNI